MLSPLLFNIYMDHVIREALDGIEHGVHIEYTIAGKVINGGSVTGIELLLALLYADDLVVICESEEALRVVMARLEAVTRKYGLIISVKKTKKLAMNTPETDLAELYLGNEKIEQVEEFVYLGSLMTKEGSSEKEIIRRISLGNYRFRQLRSLWKRREISMKTKLRIYEATVMSVVLYGAESFTCSDEDYAKLNVFHTNKLRAIVSKRRDQISNAKLFKLTGMFPLENYVRKYRLRWAGHVSRMDNSRLPKKTLFGALVEGRRGRGRPKKNWMGCLLEDLEYINTGLDYIGPGNWVAKASDSVSWRKSISSLTLDKEK